MKGPSKPGGVGFNISLTAFALFIVASASGLIVGFNYYQATKFARLETEERMDDATARISLQVEAFMEPVFEGIARLLLEFSGPNSDNESADRFARASIPILIRYDHVRSLYLGNPNGDFTQVVSFADGNPDNKLPYRANENADYALVTIRENDDGAGTRTTQSLVETGIPSGAPWSAQAEFDPRNRPWYGPAIDSSDLQRSDPYVFATSKVPGITFSQSVEGNPSGVVGLDLDLKTITSFLDSLKITRGTRLALTTSSGVMLAHSDPSRKTVQESATDKDILTLMTLREANDDVLDAVLSASDSNSSKSELTVDGQSYLFRNIPIKLGDDNTSNERLLLAVPWDEIASAATAARNRTMYVALGICALVMLLALYLARKLAKPIEVLTQETEKISQLDLTGDVDLKSNIFEIQELMNATRSMKSALGVFGKFVPETLVRQLLQSGTGGDLGGKRREMVMMFCDIKDFTKVAEASDSEELMRQLSAYLESQSGAILDHSGTIDKYIGDSIMAFWNAPIEDPQMERNACLAILEARSKLVEQNREWEARGKPVFETRYGLHKGKVIVGNVGSTERLNYTVMGSEVNLASRLEGLNKVFGTEILATSGVREAAGSDLIWRPVGRVAPKGVSLPVDVFELLGRDVGTSGSDHPPADTEAHELARSWEIPFEFIRNRDWPEAARALESFLEKWPGDGVAEYYLARANHLIAHPEDIDQDGVESFDVK